MSNIDFNTLELLVAVVSAVAAVAGVVIQVKSSRLDKGKQEDRTLPRSPGHPKQSTDGKPPQ